MDGYKYYSTQRPVDILTYPNPPDNKPVEIVNYDCDSRILVPGEPFRAWGELTYTKPLTDKQMYDYELRPSRLNPDREQPRPSITARLKENADRPEPTQGARPKNTKSHEDR